MQRATRYCGSTPRAFTRQSATAGDGRTAEMVISSIILIIGRRVGLSALPHGGLLDASPVYRKGHFCPSGLPASVEVRLFAGRVYRSTKSVNFGLQLSA
jgi:hypothetical protein